MDLKSLSLNPLKKERFFERSQLAKLLTTDSILATSQHQELMNLVAIENSQSIPNSSTQFGYGLGITRGFDAYGGKIWGHGGGTFGYISKVLQGRLMFYIETNDKNAFCSVIVVVNLQAHILV